MFVSMSHVIKSFLSAHACDAVQIQASDFRHMLINLSDYITFHHEDGDRSYIVLHVQTIS